MDCNELVEVITDYIEDRLPLEDRRRFDAHLLECPYCVVYVEQMRDTIAALGSVNVDTIEPAERVKLVELFRDWKEHGSDDRDSSRG
jgi:anti-sigma factor RsiW